MDNVKQARAASTEEWIVGAEDLCARTIAGAELLRSTARDCTDLPPNWYVVTELLIAMCSVGYALAEILDRA